VGALLEFLLPMRRRMLVETCLPAVLYSVDHVVSHPERLVAWLLNDRRVNNCDCLRHLELVAQLIVNVHRREEHVLYKH
jgi:hypothetical protein